MTTVLEYPDLELWAVAYFRAGLAAWAAKADRRWPAADNGSLRGGGGVSADVWIGGTGYDVVVRDDSGPSAQFTADRLLAVTVLGPPGAQQATQRAAERAAALLRASPEDSATPVVRVDRVNGPYAIESDTNRPTYYLTAGLRVVGSPITL